MSAKTQRAQFQKIQLAIRWLAAAFLIWEASSTAPIFDAQPVSPNIGIEIIVFYLVVCTGLLYSPGRASTGLILIVFDLVIGTLFLILYQAQWAFVLPFFLAVYAAATVSWKLSFVTSILGALLFLGVKFFLAGVSQEFLLHPAWLLFLVLGLALSTLGFFRFELAREKEKGDVLISLIEAGQFGSALTYEDLFKLSLEIVRNYFSADTFAVYLRDEEGMMKLRGVHSQDPKLFSDFNPRESKTLLADVINRRSPQTIEDLQNVPEEQEKVIPRVSALRGGMAVPLVLGNQSIGLFFAANGKAKAYDQEMLRLFQILANQAAVSYGNVKLQEKAEILAATDSVSGLYTYGFMQDVLEREFRRCKYGNLPLSGILLDADGFKRVNETHGHVTGDSVLRQLAGVIKTVTRANDVVCRYAGDQFMIILPETNRIGAMLVGERVRVTVQDYDFVVGSNIEHLTLSGGVASFPEDVETKKELIEKCEQSLSEAKKQGSNKICF